MFIVVVFFIFFFFSSRRRHTRLVSDWSSDVCSSDLLIGADLALGKDIFGDGNGSHRIPPAGVEREVRDDLGDLARLDAVVERQVEVVPHLDRLVACDQGGKRDDAAVSWCETRALPNIAEKTALRVLLQGRRHRSHIVKSGHWRRSWSDPGLSRCRTDQTEQRDRRSCKFHFDSLSSSHVAHTLQPIEHAFPYLPYCSSPTCSIQSTFLPPIVS